jgi:hypothetical protein
MALKYAVATGNWSNTATWDGGVKPQAGDDVYANGFTVTVDEDTPDTLASLNTIAESPAVAGGGFNVTGTRTIYATLVRAGSSNCINFSGGSGTTLTVDAEGGSVNGSSTSNTIYGIAKTGAGNITITGDVVGGNGSGRSAIFVSAAGGTVTITGSVTGGANATAYAVVGSAAFTTAITGNVTGGTGPAILNIAGCVNDIVGNVTAGATAAITGSVAHSTMVTGDVTGGSTIAIFGRSATITVIGNVTTTGVGAGILMDSTGGTAYVTGDVTAGASGIGILVQSPSGANIVQVTGSITATAGNNGVFMSSTASELYVSGDLNNVASTMAGSASRIYLETPTALTWGFLEWDKTTVFNLYSADVLPGSPTEADVRSGTTYGPANDLTGTLAVPPAASVAAGVPVDATVGTAAVRLQDIADVTGAQIAAAITS